MTSQDNNLLTELLKEISDNTANVSIKAMEASQSASCDYMKLCGQTLDGSNQRMMNEHLSADEREQERALQREVLAMGSAVCMKTQDTADRAPKGIHKFSKFILGALCLLTLLSTAVYIFLQTQPPDPGVSALDSPEETCYTELYDSDAGEVPRDFS